MSDDKEPTPLQNEIRRMFSDIVDEEFMNASDHPYTCRCESCRKWWKMVGPDPDNGKYGPFTREEIEEEKNG